MISRNLSLTVGICAVLTVMLTGCSQPCTPASAIGEYRMTAASDTYDLRLAMGGLGSLARDGKEETIKWDWENKQVFLDLSGELARHLAMLSAPAGSQQLAAKTQAVFLGLGPQCTSGHATKLDLRFEELGPSFSRVE